MNFSVLCLLLLVAVTQAAREQDRVTNLPGLPSEPSFRQYAGFLNVGDGKRHFYWFVESENNPSTDPVVLWLNGGPGCSSLTGFLMIHGPFRVNDDGQTLSYFEHRWNKIANMLYMESPAGVGFSHSDDQLYIHSDDSTAYDNHMALNDFFAGWPEYRTNPFFVAGESYAGVYVPTLSARLLSDPNYNFIAMANGNPVTDRSLMSNSITYYAYGHGLFDDALWNPMLDFCCEDRNASNCNFHDNLDETCELLMLERGYIVWNMGLNPYNLYQDCAGGVPDFRGVIHEDEQTITVVPPEIFSADDKAYQALIDLMKETQKTTRMRIPCTNSTSREMYLNNPDVRRALNVPENVHYWTICSANVSRNYDRQYSDVSSFYQQVFDAGKYAILFSGDLDMACDFLGSSWFADRFGRELLDEYKNWNFNQTDGTVQIAGFVKQFDNFKFITQKGAGHFVATDRPIPAFDMFRKFLANENY